MLATSSPVPILKTSKLAASNQQHQKRKISSMDGNPLSSDSSNEVNVSSPRKRVRVRFEPEVDVHQAEVLDHRAAVEPEKSAAVVREEVRRAIQRHISASDSEAYDRIKEMFSVDPRRASDDDDDEGEYEEDGDLIPQGVPTPTTLKNHLLGLLSNVASLDRSCSGLVYSVLNSEWLGRDESYVKLFIRLLGNIAAAQGTYLGAVLRMLVSHLGMVSSGAGRLPGYAPVSVAGIYSRVHTALRYVLHLIPAGSGALAPILATQFPFDTDSAKSNVAYTQNLIHLISYAPELQADILALITEKLVKIDVQIQVDMEEFEDEVGEDLVHALSTDDDDDDDDNASAVSNESEPETERVRTIKDNICKLDGMIDVLFEYYAPPFTSGNAHDKEIALDLLLSHFQTIILPTYRSRHSQFLLFHFSQASPKLVDRFATTCMQLILNKLQPGILRQSAAAYLASFVARGAHVSGEAARDIFDLLGTYMNNMRDDYEPTCRGPDLRRYGPFYATAQALLYIFCFRWRDLTTAAYDNNSDTTLDEDLDPDDTTFPPTIKEVLHRAIYSKLNPLKVCSPAIVTEFARIAHHLHLLYVFPLLETNKRLRISSFRNFAGNGASSSNSGDGTNLALATAEREIRAGDDGGYQLDAYFPFDPYQLPRSRRWLEGDYVEWRGVPGMEGEGTDVESEGDGDGDGDGEDEDEDGDEDEDEDDDE